MLTSSSSGMGEGQSFNVLFNHSGDQDLQYSDNYFDQVGFTAPDFEAFTQPMPTLDNENVSPCVSLQDIQFNSEPASTTLTNLTTPGSDPLNSPFALSTDTSPIFAGDLNLAAEADSWPPLISSDELMNDMPTEHSTEEPLLDLSVAPCMSRNASSPGQFSSRGSNQCRHSFTSGVGSKRRDKPLPAIVIDDPTDSIKVKRARNTLAARKSRQKRVQIHDELETQVADLKNQVSYWRDIALALGHQE